MNPLWKKIILRENIYPEETVSFVIGKIFFRGFEPATIDESG
jgi:hypothetical protein